VREATGLAAYAAGHFAEALAELRAARRITGDHTVLPVIAECERALGRPNRALAVAADPVVASLDVAARVEMSIVASGARRDLGQPAAALQVLQSPHLRPDARDSWSPRLFYAYAEALLAAGRIAEALAWFGWAADADVIGETDADERVIELSGVTFEVNADAGDNEKAGNAAGADPRGPAEA
jgi:tetratricopeptide (TPR) repeat protein